MKDYSALLKIVDMGYFPGRQLTYALALLLFAPRFAAGDVYEPPANYYSGATGAGATLKAQLAAAISAGHIQRNYGDFRFAAAITDADPEQPGNILLVYNRQSVPATWDQGVTWNREHVWPQSRQPGSASNSTTGNLGDPHALRPGNPSVNSSRGNKPFGFDATTGVYRHVDATYFFPGDFDKGDIARQLFYSDVRYGASLGLSLVDTIPAGNQMGDLSSLVAWHYLDEPDEFERRRNHTIYSQAANPLYYTNNRSPFVDRPELVWSVYVDQANDSQITIHGGTPTGSGGSVLNLNMGSVIVGGPALGGNFVTLTKTGNAGTYFEVTTSGLATSSLTGRHNAFRMGEGALRSLHVDLNLDASSPGVQSGVVTINNLDITAGVPGGGANDADDHFHLSVTVLDHANPSFSGLADVNVLSFDFGQVALGSPAPAFDFAVFNLAAPSGYTAGLVLDSVTASGDFSVLTTDLPNLGDTLPVAAGLSTTYLAMLDTSMAGAFSAEYVLNFMDEDLPGAAHLGQLTLLLSGTVAASENADFDGNGLVDGADFLIWQRGFGRSSASLTDGDANGDGIVDAGDLGIWRAQFTAGPSTVVPEPRFLALALAGLAFAVRRMLSPGSGLRD